MNRELYMCFLPAISFALFALGGTQITIDNSIRGWKGWRRIILPMCYAVALFLAGIAWWMAVCIGLQAWAVFSLPYGDKTPYWLKAIIGCAYGLIGFPLPLSFWNLVTAISFISLWILANKFMLTAKWFAWSLCQGLFGLFVGIQLSYQLLK